MFVKRFANLIQSIQLNFDGKEKITLQLDWMGNTKHSKNKTNNSEGGLR